MRFYWVVSCHPRSARVSGGRGVLFAPPRRRSAPRRRGYNSVPPSRVVGVGSLCTGVVAHAGTSTGSVTAFTHHLPTIIVQTRGEPSLLWLSRVPPIIIENNLGFTSYGRVSRTQHAVSLHFDNS